MKKLLCIFSSLLILITLSACGPKTSQLSTVTTAPDVTTQTTCNSNDIETTAPIEDLPIVPQPMVSVVMPMQNEVYETEDGNILLNYNTQYMILPISEQEIADKITIEFLNRIEETAATKDSILASAKNAYANANNWIPYQYTVTYSPKRIDTGVLSLLGCDVSYLGAHIDKIYHSVNYSMTTGHNLSLPNIITSNSHIETLCNLVIDTLSKSEDQFSLHDDYRETVNQYFNDGINDAWFFSAKGLCFFFSPYDIAPYSAGVVIAEIPYQVLTGILKDEYFPAEQANAPGTIMIKEYTQENLESFSMVSELNLTDNHNKFLFCTDKAIHDIVISVGSVATSGMFIEECSIYALSNLTVNDAIEVFADLSGTNALQISYYSGDKHYNETVILNNDTGLIEFYVNN